MIHVNAIKIPHPAQVAGGETWNIGITCFQIGRRCNSRPLFRAQGNQAANGVTALRLCLFRSQNRVQRGEQLAVISGLSNIHGVSFPAYCANAINF